jgi:lipopolysaccharide/colanic/teichoic acid biosynthesis glycosyltransferase
LALTKNDQDDTKLGEDSMESGTNRFLNAAVCGPMIRMPGTAMRRSSKVRLELEASLAAILLLILLPLLLTIILLIRLDSPGPAIFRQTRVGENLRLFTFFKFRTMYQDARQRFPELYDYGTATAAEGDFLFKQPKDPRVTRIGRWLRRTGLDELPNLINVMKRDCGFVGPRPDIPEMLPHYSASQRIRFSVPQGLFCLAHIMGASRLTFTQTAELDADYTLCRSLWLDLRILARLPTTILKGQLH